MSISTYFLVDKMISKLTWSPAGEVRKRSRRAMASLDRPLKVSSVFS